jgi:CheY-like chemotaxis protein
MKILFLDDDDNRHEIMAKICLRESITFVYDARAAIAALAEDEFDVVYLDHDLGGVTSQNRMDLAQDGRVVARWIAANAGRFASTTFVIHSLNFAGATEMASLIGDAGLKVTRLCFSRERIRAYDHGRLTA